MSATTESTDLQQLLTRIDKLTEAVAMLCTQSGTRITRQQFADRLGIHRNTLATRLNADRKMPRPETDGRWLLSDVIEWEQRCAQH